jgi:hypothetical protein
MVSLQEMLLQTPDDQLLVLPTWPSDWDVDFVLHAPKSTIVSGRVVGGCLAALEIQPSSRWSDVKVMDPYVLPKKA